MENKKLEPKYKKIKILAYIVIVIIIILSGIIEILDMKEHAAIKKIDSFEACAEKFFVVKSIPAKCSTPDDRQFVQSLSDEQKANMLEMTY